MGKRIVTPCYQCESRYLGCHGKCEKYKAYKEQYSVEERRERIANISHIAKCDAIAKKKDEFARKGRKWMV